MPPACLFTVHALREVDPHSPAELLGIQEGELLLGVNEELIVNMRHNDVVNRIRQSGQQVTLTTISSQGLDFFTRVGTASSSDAVKEKEE